MGASEPPATAGRDLRPVPPWSAPPDNVIPGACGYEAVLAASTEAIITVSVLWAYPVGFEYATAIRLREPQRHGVPELGPFFVPESRDPDTGAPRYRPGEEFDFAVVFADGRTPERRPIGNSPSPDDPEPATGIAQRGQRDGGNAQHWDSLAWIWPLPPSGALAFLCSWPAMAIGPTRVEMDAGPIRAAGARAVELWPPLPAWHPPGPGDGDDRRRFPPDPRSR